MKYTKREYSELLKEKSTDSKILKDVFFAFVIGGLICVIGQCISDIYTYLGLNEESVKTAVSVTMIFIGSLFTGLNLYGKLAKYAGGGTLVPITGFANAIVSPAMEFKKEGLVLGLASKMFVIAGPVLVYGITASTVAGVIYAIISFINGGVL